MDGPGEQPINSAVPIKIIRYFISSGLTALPVPE
jgi:hypothetical protein